MLIKRTLPILCKTMISLRCLSCWSFVWTLCVTWRFVTADLDKTCTLDNRVSGNHGICGEHLADILHFLCGEGGYHGGYQKRSIPDEIHSPFDSAGIDTVNTKQPFLDTAILDSKLFLPKEQALSHLRRDVKRSARYLDIHGTGTGYRGIVCECCHHRCDIKELRQYCADPRSAFGGRFSPMGKRSIPDTPRKTTKTNGSLTKALLDLSRLWDQNDQNAALADTIDNTPTGENKDNSEKILNQVNDNSFVKNTESLLTIPQKSGGN